MIEASHFHNVGSVSNQASANQGSNLRLGDIANSEALYPMSNLKLILNVQIWGRIKWPRNESYDQFKL